MIITGNSKKDGIHYHSKTQCAGTYCTLHKPSKHVMRDWPMNLRTDSWAAPLIERICKHGCGHPDPDSVTYLESISRKGSKGTWGVHGCDGCCTGNFLGKV
jgi:hypothetical protein